MGNKLVTDPVETVFTDLMRLVPCLRNSIPMGVVGERLMKSGIEHAHLSNGLQTRKGSNDPVRDPNVEMVYGKVLAHMSDTLGA